jgi:CRISPR-associated protein Csh1
MNSKNEEFSIELILNSPSKKATFLLGVLTRKLMNIQYRELGSTPFYNNLWGLSLNQRKIKKLYPMVINKLREYDAGYMINLEEKISKNLAQSENDWKLSRDETSYYFVLGFTLFNLDKNKDNDGDIDE